MPIVTLFQNPNQIKLSKPLITIIYEIKKGLFKAEVTQLRDCFKNDLDTEFDQLKRMIPLVSAAGHFKQEGTKLKMVTYSGFQILEAFYLPPTKKEQVKRLLRNDPHCFACFDNITGLGIHILIKTNAHQADHKEVFRLVKNYYKRLTGVHSFSSQGAYLDYLFSMTYDRYAYINLKAAPFLIRIDTTNKTYPNFKNA